VSPAVLAISPIGNRGSCRRVRASHSRKSIRYRCGGRPAQPEPSREVVQAHSRLLTLPTRCFFKSSFRRLAIHQSSHQP
jgi:hypothetical protein